MEYKEYVELLFKSALKKESPSLAAVDEVILIVEKAIEELEKQEG